MKETRQEICEGCDKNPVTQRLNGIPMCDECAQDTRDNNPGQEITGRD